MNPIFEQIDYFYKMAAILQAPQYMNKQITQWAYSIYCGAMLPIINKELKTASEEKAQELLTIQNICFKYFNPKDSNPQYFPIKLNDIPYFSDLEQLDLEVSFKKALIEPVIKTEFIFNTEKARSIHHESWSGLWNGNLLIHHRLLPTKLLTINNLEKMLESIERTVYHELQHLVQEYLQRIKGLKEWGGLPPNKTRDTKQFDHLGNILNQPQKTVEHTLRDVEFYTNLTETIKDFYVVLFKYPTNLRKLLFNVWVGKNSLSELEKADKDIFLETKTYIDNAVHFFDSLKNNQFEKYKKAVAELYKAVDQYL